MRFDCVNEIKTWRVLNSRASTIHTIYTQRESNLKAGEVTIGSVSSKVALLVGTQ